MIILNKRIAYVDKPHWTDNPPLMGHSLNKMLVEFETIERYIQKITIEVDTPTQIKYFIVPGRWVDRLYANGFLRRGTL